MEQKIKALKYSSKVISVIAKIIYTVMIVAMSLLVAFIIFIAVTNGNVSSFKIGETVFHIFEKTNLTGGEMISTSVVLLFISGFFFTIFLFTYFMFHDISVNGDPFTKKHVRNTRIIGILTAAMPFVVGFVDTISSLIAKTSIPDIYMEIPGIGVGAVIFCLSFIIDYGYGLKTKLEEKNK